MRDLTISQHINNACGRVDRKRYKMTEIDRNRQKQIQNDRKLSVCDHCPMLPILLVTLCFFFSSVCSSCILHSDRTRLPHSIIPNYLHLDLQVSDPNSGSLTFSGTSDIVLAVVQPTSCIVVHSMDLVWGSENVTLRTETGEVVKPMSVEFDGILQQAKILFEKDLEVGSARMTVSFDGVINTVGTGFFISDNVYVPSKETSAEKFQILKTLGHSKVPKGRVLGNGEKMYATQFEETSARRAFVCFDEPIFRVYTEASITVPQAGLTVLFNTKETGAPTVFAKNGVIYEKFSFVRSKHTMAIYLTAFAIGRFSFLERNYEGVRYRIYFPVGADAYAHHGLNMTILSSEFFGRKFSFPYVLINDKLDSIAVPNIVEDAMENQGLCTYDPTFLLTDATYSLESRQFVTLVVSHEISHQWFGDTVTVEYWPQEYLPEGFARYFQYLFADLFFPEEHILSSNVDNYKMGFIDFFDFTFIPSMSQDVLGKLPAPYVPDRETTVKLAYYEKGASLNRMFSLYLGLENWFNALKYHIHAHSFGSPQLPDLLSSFEAVGFNVRSKFNSWLLQPGMPMVTLSIEKSTDSETVVIRAKQQPSSPFINSTQLWWIPLSVTLTPKCLPFCDQKPFEIFFDFNQAVAEYFVPLGDYYIQGNANFTSYILMNYSDPSQLDRLIEIYSSDSDFSAMNRILFEKQLLYLGEIAGDFSAFDRFAISSAKLMYASKKHPDLTPFINTLLADIKEVAKQRSDASALVNDLAAVFSLRI